MNHSLRAVLESISPVDVTLSTRARAHLDDLTKPRGSLGALEDAALRLFLVAGGQTPLCVDPAVIVVAAGDHGVTRQGVSPYPQEVTTQMLANILEGGAAISVLSRLNGLSMTVVDAGCAGAALEHPRLVNLRLGPGTADLSEEPAMSVEDCQRALLCGVDMARRAVDGGARLLATGEMGIGNSTPATALFCALLGLSPAEAAGPGAGLNPAGVRHKISVVEKALRRHAAVAAAVSASGGPGDALAALAALGGYEIAVLAGVALGAASCRVPVLVDGFISTSAYAAARSLCPAVADYAFLAHASAEPGYAGVIAALGQEPLLRLHMRLGEGTGCALALPLLRAAAALFNDMATFSGARVTGDMKQPV
ncbi:MAG: nicotinate-nucleotide--dimethylbenzimidazole phosphoribosyltransferase [Desulfovibrionaceae bacterium]|nr:nicotinate-nucleotide--dimethylbenzimidazole phosphoribosyltransferase [Desulfovibrionaceae bacterium]